MTRYVSGTLLTLALAWTSDAHVALGAPRTAVASPTVHAVQTDAGATAIQRIEPRAQWGDLRVAESTQQALRTMAVEPRMQGAATLFSGADGTGKARAAEVLARELRLVLYRIDLAALQSRYIGETEKNIDRVFDEAQRSSVLLYFDEADALFGRGGSATESNDRYANQEIGYLLQRLERFDGVAILATNARAKIDPALLRRFRRVVEFGSTDAGKPQ